MSTATPVTIRSDPYRSALTSRSQGLRTLCRDMATYLRGDWSNTSIAAHRSRLQHYSYMLQSLVAPSIASGSLARSSDDTDVEMDDAASGSSGASSPDEPPLAEHTYPYREELISRAEALHSLSVNMIQDINAIKSMGALAPQMQTNMKRVRDQVGVIRSLVTEMNDDSDEAFGRASRVCPTILTDPGPIEKTREDDLQYESPEAGASYGATTTYQGLLAKRNDHLTFATLKEHFLVFPKGVPRHGLLYIDGEPGIINPTIENSDGTANPTEQKCSIETPSSIRVVWHPKHACTDFGCGGSRGDRVGPGTRAIATLDTIDLEDSDVDEGDFRGEREESETGEASANAIRIKLGSTFILPLGISPKGMASISVFGRIQAGGSCMNLSGHEIVDWTYESGKSSTDVTGLAGR